MVTAGRNTVRERVLAQVQRLPTRAEKDALAWIEQVGLFDEGVAGAGDAPCRWGGEDQGATAAQH